ncbi:hypothetical protein BDW74DRAFT_185554 [Aspergillus multicolor]|uniref:LysM peptidoglycan-binding domain-containing protein n=1 Tax=Aspergillus multicolor TaxID=41759 RepID=UPI003CCDE076
MTDGYIGSFDNATTTALVCAAGCETSIAQLHDSVLTSCGASAELIPGISFLNLVGALWSGWNQSCFVDPSTGANCNDELASWDNFTTLADIPTADLCSYCYVKKLDLMQQDAYAPSTYADGWKLTFKYVAATCNLTVTDFNATVSAFNASVPAALTSSSCVSGDTYIAQEGDTCNSIALAKGVSTVTLYYINPNLANCSTIAAGTALCLPLTCTDIYSVQANDTYPSIAVANLMTSSKLANWNSQLNPDCSNLHSTNPDWGSVLCVSPPGGEYTGDALNTTTTPTSLVAAPAGARVALGTTLDCGSWFINTASLNYNCSDICLANSIAIHLFTEANPSLNYTTCNDDLVPGEAYCVDPLPAGDTCASIAADFDTTLAEFLAWNPAVSSDCTSGFWADEDYCVGVITNTTSVKLMVTPSSSSKSASSFSSSSSSSTVTPPVPTQSGIPANCDKYVVAKSADDILILSFASITEGDTCATAEENYGITKAQFLAINPAVSSDCESGFWAKETYCVSLS